MKRIIGLLLCCLLLTGCGSWMDGEYSSVTPHKPREQAGDQAVPSVKNVSQIKQVLEDFTQRGSAGGLISVEEFPASALEGSMDRVIADFLTNHPIGAYALEDITYELGTTGGMQAVSVTLTYSRSPEEIRAICTARDREQVEQQLWQALETFEPGLVLRVENYNDIDLNQMVSDFALENPNVVMELPLLSVLQYPDKGTDRILDVRFTYQTSRDSLRTMQRYVKPVFDSAAYYVSSEEESSTVKYSRLCTFLMERNDYQLQTSITPTYSLLRHGVGDSKAFAMVYAAMCRRAELECWVVTGTKQGEAWFWNIICDDGAYYHVDVLRPGGYARLADSQMTGYVWDYSAYPACGG